jgi:fructose-1,6-bisphosphatase/sedoheptulose 1,7-bisphosphatase-like protein
LLLPAEGALALKAAAEREHLHRGPDTIEVNSVRHDAVDLAADDQVLQPAEHVRSCYLISRIVHLHERFAVDDELVVREELKSLRELESALVLDEQPGLMVQSVVQPPALADLALVER